jgi:hypothetical protein
MPAAVGEGFARSASEMYFSGEDDEPLPEPAGLSDSHYEVSPALDDDGTDSDYEMPAHRSSGSARDEGPFSATFEPAGLEIVLTNPWYDRFIDSWSRYHWVIALGFGTSSLAVLGYLLARALLAGATLDSSVTSLIVGCVTTVAFMLLSVSATVLMVLLIDLGRSIRRLSVHSGRDDRVASD